jgi:hypothetical protein
MKLPPSISCARAQAGVLLIECIVYIAIFAIVIGLGMATFYLCWDDSKALLYATDDIASALRAGERWRADVRSATGKIIIETTAQEEVLRIPHGTNAILYRFSAGEIHRQLASSDFSELLLPTVQASQMVKDTRGTVNAWRWELELKSRREETHVPLLFTFEAVAKTTP